MMCGHVLSYDRRVIVVIRYLLKRWYTVSGVITYCIRSSRSDTPYQTGLQILGIGILTIHSLGGGQLATLRNKCYYLFHL